MALATRVLKLVNSSYFGLRREITSIQHAVMVLGTAQLRSLVLSGAVSELFDRQGVVGSFSRAEFWKHSIAAAAASRAIAAESRLVDPEIAFTAGLIHDMGKVVIDRHLHADFILIVTRMEQDGLPMREAEAAVLGVTHEEIGNHLAMHWNLPQILREAIGFHHQVADAPEDQAVAATVAVADALVRELQIGNGGGATCAPINGVIRLAGLDEDHFANLKAKLAVVLPDQVVQLAGVV